MDNIDYAMEKYLRLDKFLTEKPNLEKMFEMAKGSVENFKAFLDRYEKAILNVKGPEIYNRGYSDGNWGGGKKFSSIF